MRTLKRLLSSFPGKWLLIVAISITLILSVGNIIVAHTLRGLLDSAISRDLASLNYWLHFGIVVSLVGIAVRYFRTRLVGRYTEQGMAMLRGEASLRISLMKMSELQGKHTGDYVSRFTNDLNQVSIFFSETLINVFFKPLSAILALAYLLYIDWKLTLLSLFGIPLFFFVGTILSKPLEKYSRIHQENLAVLNGQVQDGISGVEVARAFNLREQLNMNFEQAVSVSVSTRIAMAYRETLLRGLSFIIGVTPFLILFGIGGLWVIRGDLTPGSLIAFIDLLNHLTFPVAQLPQLIGFVRRDMAAAERVMDILELPSELRHGKTASPSNSIAIEFEAVDFAYPGREEKVLQSLTFNVKKGETVALVGASGSGKSTVLKLLLDFYLPQNGSLSIFGLPLPEWDLSELRSFMALVSQDTYLFPGTIRENISYGCIGSTDEEITSAAQAAMVHDFISQLPAQYETRVGELGSKLSGGQRQRIALARAILRNAPLLLLDEATSALDVESEALVQQALDKRLLDKTALVIAHRLSTIKNADRIMVLEAGRIIEEGTHNELLERGGNYADLYRRQLSSDMSAKEAV